MTHARPKFDWSTGNIIITNPAYYDVFYYIGTTTSRYRHLTHIIGAKTNRLLLVFLWLLVVVVVWYFFVKFNHIKYTSYYVEINPF